MADKSTTKKEKEALLNANEHRLLHMKIEEVTQELKEALQSKEVSAVTLSDCCCLSRCLLSLFVHLLH